MAGGLLIGLGASFLVLTTGRILGVSGIVGGLMIWPLRESGWRLAFMLAGFVTVILVRHVIG